MLKIKELRLKNKIKQKELSAYLKVPANTLCTWEQGLSEPPFEKLLKIADYFNVSTDYLFGRDETNTA